MTFHFTPFFFHLNVSIFDQIQNHLARLTCFEGLFVLNDHGKFKVPYYFEYRLPSISVYTARVNYATL